MAEISLSTNINHEEAIMLSCPFIRFEYEMHLREWVYTNLHNQLDTCVAKAISARYQLGIALLMDEIRKAEED